MNVNLYRGGTPEFRPAFCCGDYAEFKPPFIPPHIPGTPPYDSHADAARGQGFLNLSFPFVPQLLDTQAHRWMWPALQQLSAVNDTVRLFWVPFRGYLESFHMELTRFDAALDGVYVAPVAERCTFNFTTNEYEYADEQRFEQDIASYGNATRVCLGTPGADEPPYIFARFPQVGADLPATFGHNIVKRDANGEPTGGLDDAYGAVIIGLRIVAGDPEKIKELWRGRFELWVTSKFIGFECHGFTG